MTTREDRPDAGADDIAARANRIRQHVIRMVSPLGEGYAGQGLGSADILATLYFSELRGDAEHPDWPERDRFILSPAHYAVGLYAVLAERGVLPLQDLAHYGQDGDAMEIIASERLTGIEGTCGSLAQATSVGIGQCLALRRRGSEARTYVMLGDGEQQEGQTWEAAMAAGAYGLDNLCVIVDVNGMQVDGAVDSVMPLGDLTAKWRAFGWHVCEVDGHDIGALKQAFAEARDTKGKPSAIMARTIVSKGVSFLEGEKTHFVKLPPDVAGRALAELEQAAQ